MRQVIALLCLIVVAGVSVALPVQAQPKDATPTAYDPIAHKRVLGIIESNCVVLFVKTNPSLIAMPSWRSICAIR